MYQPPHFREGRIEAMHDLIRRHPLGLLVSEGAEGPIANAIPFLLDAQAGSRGTLQAHLARANPQWQAISERPERPVLAVFQGVDAYVSPSWYETKRETGKVVPTWNYVVVQARGKVRVVDDPAWIESQITRLTNGHEAGRGDPWQVSDAPRPFVEAQIRGIVGIEIEILDLSGKWKVSQNRPVADRAGVARGLGALADAEASEMADMVRSYGKLDPA